ncbi:MAG: penicillin-binding transpeptidase domain-containing protein [Bdellovibrionota bacterium]
MKITKRPKTLILLVISALVGGFYLFSLVLEDHEQNSIQRQLQSRLDRRLQISRSLTEPLKNNTRPSELKIAIENTPETYKVNYTIDQRLQNEAEKLLKQYRPDYGAVVMMDAKTGKILSMASYERNPNLNTNLALRATYPAASVFKIVTSAAAIDKAGVTPAHNIHFNGGNYTLYRKNVMSDRINRWTRRITLRDAFAQSINTAFGRLSLENLNPEDLMNYANRFMFNQEIPTDFQVEMGITVVPNEKGYEMTQVASGFNRLTRMSPIQGAMIAGAIVNQGKMVIPYIVESLQNDQGEIVYNGETVDRGQVVNPESATQLKILMSQTVHSGTSRRSFRPLTRDRRFQEIEVGGKTGHLSGDNPKGRVDWFVGYAYDEQDRKIAVSAITVNKEFWTVKSSHLAQTMFMKYFEPLTKRKVANSRVKPQLSN